MASEQTNAESQNDTKEKEPTVQLPTVNELVIKHPLQNQWQLWYFRPEKNKKWTENLLDVINFGTVEDFWALYNNIELPSHLSLGSDYSIFKRGIRPMWEDDHNKAGGRWLFTFIKKSTAPQQMDETWLEVLLCMIGEAFGEDTDQICGAVINIRGKVDKISVWTNDCRSSESILNIGRTLKERTRYPQMISYEAHSDTIIKTGSIAKHLHSL